MMVVPTPGPQGQGIRLGVTPPEEEAEEGAGGVAGVQRGHIQVAEEVMSRLLVHHLTASL